MEGHERKGLSFRQKILLSQFALLIIFIVLLFPFVENTVDRIIRRSLKQSVNELVDQVELADSTKQMIDILKDQAFFVYFRVSLLTANGEILYDSHLESYLGDDYTPYYPSAHPEVIQALREGEGYSEGYSQVFSRKFAYVSKSFYFQNETYILRIAFPFSRIEELTHAFELGFIIFGGTILVLFSAITWLIFSRLSRPIKMITEAVDSYEDGAFFHIKPDRSLSSNDDFRRLALTLNSLSSRIETEMSHVKEERNEKEAILESLQEGVIAVDEKMHVRYINYTGSKMLSIPKKQLLEESLLFVTSEKNPKLLEKCQKLLRSSQELSAVLTDTYESSQNKQLYIDLIAAPKAGKHGAILVLQDKSSHYKVLEKGKDFVANASHELRTPITIIKGFAETMQDVKDLPAEVYDDIIDKIVRNCERMESLVKNLLILADVENLPASRFKESDLLTLIQKVKHLVSARYPEAKITIEKEDEAILIDCDRDLIELALFNLIDNAAKYSPSPAAILVLIEQLDKEIKVTISDKGIGIPMDDQEHIFDRFYTVDKARSRRLGGAGLGLSLVKTIIDKHEGSISVASKEGEGTTFIFYLPLTHHS